MNFNTDEMGAEVKLAASEPTKKRYEVTLRGARLEALESKWVSLARGQAKLPGFRRGHLSDDVVLEQLGSWVRKEVTQEAAVSVARDIAKKEELRAVITPLITKVEYEFKERLGFEIIFEVEPTLVLKNYRGLELQRRRQQITSEEVDSELERLLEESEAQYLVPLEGKGQSNARHWALLNAKYNGGNGGFKDPGAGPLWQWERELVSLDEECLPLGLREALEGSGSGHVKAWEIAIDEDCPVPQLQGKKLKGHLEILELKRLQSGHGTAAELAEKNGASLDQWKQEVRKALEARFQARQHRILRDQIVAELLRENTIDVPQAELEVNATEMLQRARTLLALSARQLSSDHEGELRVKYRIEAANEIRLGYIIREIARREGIGLTEEDFKKKIDAAHDEEEREAMMKNQEAVFKDILMDKVFDFLIANAKIEEVEV